MPNGEVNLNKLETIGFTNCPKIVLAPNKVGTVPSFKNSGLYKKQFSKKQSLDPPP